MEQRAAGETVTMEYEQFLAIVGQAAQAGRDEAEGATRATLETVAERLSPGEARALGARLPPELLGWIFTDDRARPFDADEFLHRLAEREGVDPGTAERHAGAVFFALRRTLPPDEFADLAAALPQDFAPLLGDTDVLTLGQLLLRVAIRTGLDVEGARRATDAVLETLAERIAGGEVVDLISRLPIELHAALKRGRQRGDGTGRRMSADEFVRRVAALEGVPVDEAREHVRAVFFELRDAIPDEFVDVTVQLPPEYSALLPHP